MRPLRSRSPFHVSALLAGSGTVLLLLGAGAATATPKVDGEHLVTLCHATASDTNPYVEITVDVASVLGSHGHDGHEGPVWVADHPKHEAWGDIIPSFDFGPGEQYAGRNAVDGAALLASHCEPPEATTTSTTAEVTTTSTTEAPTTTSTTEAPTTTSTTEAPTTTSDVLGESGSSSTTSTPTSSTTSTTEPPTSTTVLGESGSSTSTSTAAAPSGTTGEPTTLPTVIDPAHGSSTVAVTEDAGLRLPATGLETDLLVPLGASLLLASLGTLGLSRRVRHP